MRNCVHCMYYWVNTLAVLSPGEGQSESWKGRAWNEGEAGLLPSPGEAGEVTAIDNIRSQNSLMAFKDGNGPPQHSVDLANCPWRHCSNKWRAIILDTYYPPAMFYSTQNAVCYDIFLLLQRGFWAEVALVLLLTAASKIICTAGTWLGSLLLLPVHSTYTLEPIRRTGQGFMSCSKVV